MVGVDSWDNCNEMYKQRFGRELVAAWHSVVLKAQVAHYPHDTRVYKYLVMVGSYNDKAGAS